MVTDAIDDNKPTSADGAVQSSASSRCDEALDDEGGIGVRRAEGGVGEKGDDDGDGGGLNLEDDDLARGRETDGGGDVGLEHSDVESVNGAINGHRDV